MRVFVTEDAWARFRVAAAELGLTLGAYVGQLFTQLLDGIDTDR